MQKLPVLAALLSIAASAVAQNCTNPPAARTFSNRDEFIASFYYTLGGVANPALGGNHLFDLTAQTSISISQIKTWTYDQGVGNPPVPNQVGATSVVNVYTCPTTRIGNEANAPTNPGSPWTLLGTGTITVVQTPGESPIVFAPPLALPAGSYGVAINYLPTVSGPAPGVLHCLGLSPNPALTISDQFVTYSNDAIQGTAWTGVGTDSPNLRITYTPDPNAAHYVAIGDGCYFRPHAWFENFNPAAGLPDVANKSLQCLNLGNNYLVVQGGAAIVPSTSPNLVLSAYGVSSSGNWDDALTVPITLPFTFNAPGGISTNDITISSNGCVYLAAVTNAAYTPFTGASYGSTATFRDGPPRIAGYFHDLDPQATGSMHYDVDPANQFVRITWNAVSEWGVPAAVNSIQITLYPSGNIDIVTGVLGNQSAGNNAIMGYTPGLGSRLPAAIDISATLPGGITTGDGAIPPVLGMNARPVMGTSPNIVTSNITPGTLIQLLTAGAALQPVPVDLGFIGMPGCQLVTNPFVYLTNVLGVNNTFEQPFNIPVNPVFQNIQLTFQAAPLTAGLNPLGIILSNGICVRITNL